MKKLAIIFMLALIVGWASTALAREWTYYPLPGTMALGPHPSLALINGERPVVCDDGQFFNPVMMSPLGWTTRTDLTGPFLAGDGGTTIVSNSAPVKYGKDGRFYSSINLGWGAPRIGTTWENGTWVPNGTDILLSSSGNAVCSADARGQRYLVCSGAMAMSSVGATWVPELFFFSTDMAVSDFGDVVVSGYNNQTQSNVVAWFDYQQGWRTRSFPTVPLGYLNTIGVDFDSKGNFGVAYVNSASELWFSYLDLETGDWEDGLVGPTDIPAYMCGTALEFNRYDYPVIAAGHYVIYDPTVPEPGTLVLLLGSIGWLVRRRSL